MRDAAQRCTTHEHSGIVVHHDCGPTECMSLHVMVSFVHAMPLL